jgi:hypothetical protein
MSINLNKPKTIIFHPGIGKTATSAIQKIGFNLPNNANKNPYFSPYGVLGGANNLFASNHPQFSLFKHQEQWDLLLELAFKSDRSTVISSEFLIRDNPKHIETMLKQAKAKGLNVKVVVAIRNYTDYLVSAFLQAVKVNWGIPPHEDVFRFCERELTQIRMPLLVDHWSRHIGDENIFLMDYDENKNDFVDLFFKTIGVTLSGGSQKDIKVNTSIKLEIAPMLRHFDQTSDNKLQREQFIKFVNTLDYKNDYAVNIKKRIDKNIVRKSFSHDKDRLSARYTWV